MAPPRLTTVAMMQKLFLAVAFLSVSAFANFNDALCSFVPGEGGLLKAICQMPGCPNGSDCSAPMIHAGTASIEYFEPILQWKETCPNPGIASSCWEVFIDYKLLIGAVDSSGISSIGANLTQDIEGKKIEKKSWSKSTKKAPDGRYEMNGAITVHVPAGRALELKVSELCAKDFANNEACYPVSLSIDGAKPSRR